MLWCLGCWRLWWFAIVSCRGVDDDVGRDVVFVLGDVRLGIRHELLGLL